MEWYYILLICVGALFLLLTALGLLIYHIAFGARCDKNPLLTYFSAEHFSLTAKPVQVRKGKYELRGNIYTKGERQKQVLVVFCHGMGPGHAAYMTEINGFCEQGYTVLAIDNRGCGLSQGKSIKGFYSGVQTAKAAIDYARSSKEFEGYKICLAGHSWGGYSVLCASSEREVDGVVALSAPVSPLKIIYFNLIPVFGKVFAAILIPFVGIADFLHFGFKSNKNAAKCAVKSGVPTLLIHGDKDFTVPMNRAAYHYAKGGKVSHYLAEGKAHNPYNTVKAQELIIELSSKRKASSKMSDGEKKFFADFDYVAATEEDGQVMGAIYNFIDSL